MYNGIGLETARGSGTNGFVQRNLSFIKRQKDKVDYKTEEELKKIDSQFQRGPNQEILEHEKKRKIELKCLEMSELMEEQGYSNDEINKKVTAFRKMLIEQGGKSTDSIELDELGRPIAKATHQIAEANQKRNENLKAAFGISEYYKDGSSFDPERKTKEEAAKNLALAQKKYSLLKAKSSSEEEESAESEPEKEKLKKKKKSHLKAKSSSEEDSEDSDAEREKRKRKRSRHSDDRDSKKHKKEHKSSSSRKDKKKKESKRR